MSIAQEAVAPNDERVEAATEDPVAARQQRLATGVAAMRVRSQGIPLDRVLLIAGSVLIPLGALFILLGWYGASHTPQLFEQIPYLISGGLLGVALVGAGGFFYFGYWLTRQVYEARSQNEQLVAALTRIETQLQSPTGPLSVSLTQPAALEPSGARGAGNGRSRAARGRSVSATVAPTLVATATGTMLHRPDCAVVAGRDGLVKLPADAKGYKPCRICDPLAVD
ncbi:MAG TPA: hypothetical protein VNY84_02735 [Acidimicrobiales bacterium]|nr:hypothetical protein [Acidimicrobiales bacterium]